MFTRHFAPMSRRSSPLRRPAQSVYNVSARRPVAMSMNSRARDEETTNPQIGLFGDEPDRPTAPPTPDELAEAVLDHLNGITERTGAARFTSPTSIKERLRDGATLEDLLLVTDFCHALWWGDRKMETYIRPKTLFGKENFPEYLVRGRKWQRDGRPSLLGGEARTGAADRSIQDYSAHVKGGTG